MPALYVDQIPVLDSLKSMYQRRADPCTVTGVTGFGKTTISSAFIRWLLENTEERIWITCHRVSLVSQWWLTLKGDGLADNVGVMWAGCPKFDKGGDLMPRNQPDRRVQITMIQTLGARSFKRVPPEQLPTVMIHDEAHRTYRFTPLVDLWRKVAPWRVALTGTPTSHPSARVPFESVFPADNWIISKTATEMIESGRWCPIRYQLPSEDLQREIAARFAGIRLNANDEYPTTKQRDVFAEVYPAIILEWMKSGLGDRPAGFVCCDIKTARAVHGMLRVLGIKAELLISGTKNPTDLLDKFRDGEVQALVTVDCFIEGVDVPRAAVCVLMKLFGGIGQLHQLIGRFVRPHESKDEAVIFDAAGNLGIHEKPEAISDWRDLDVGAARHYDADAEICAKCGHDHKSVPKPLSMRDRTLKFTVRTGSWLDEQMAYEHPLACHKCGAAVTYDQEQLFNYTDWLSTTREALASGSLPTRFEGAKGIYVGGDYGQQLTGGLMYEAGIWQLATGESENTTAYLDRSEEFIQRMAGAEKTLEAAELTAVKVKYLAVEDQLRVAGSSFSKLNMDKTRDTTETLTDVLMLSYCKGRSQRTLTKAKLYTIAHDADYESAAELAIRRMAICPVSQELVADWVAWLDANNIQAEKTTRKLINALRDALIGHNPALGASFGDRFIALFDAA